MDWLSNMWVKCRAVYVAAYGTDFCRRINAITHYIDAGGGSRGARIILDRVEILFRKHEMVFVMPGAFVQAY